MRIGTILTLETSGLSVGDVEDEGAQQMGRFGSDPDVIYDTTGVEGWFDGSESSLHESIRLDLAMQGLDRWRAHYRVTRGVVYFQWLLRRTEYWCHDARSGPVAAVMAAQLKVRLRRQSERLGFDVPRGVFGPGLSIAHSGLLVVSPRTSVGARCRIHQGVTIGASAGGAPVIGNDVFIGPNAVVIGPLTVGDGAFIYPGAVCTVDVPEGHSAGGVPARVRAHSGRPWRPDQPLARHSGALG